MAVSGLATGCGREPAEGPKPALRAFMSAVERGDRKEVWKRLGPKTQEKITQWAEEAEASTGGEVDLEPQDLISAGARVAAHPDWEPKKLEVVEETEDGAIVEVSAPAPPHALIRSDGLVMAWVAGSAKQLRASPSPAWTSVEVFPLMGLTLVGFRFPHTAEPEVTAGHRHRVRLVKVKGKWRVELSGQGFGDGDGR
jgi:hypothetical protein